MSFIILTFMYPSTVCLKKSLHFENVSPDKYIKLFFRKCPYLWIASGLFFHVGPKNLTIFPSYPRVVHTSLLKSFQYTDTWVLLSIALHRFRHSYICLLSMALRKQEFNDTKMDYMCWRGGGNIWARYHSKFSQYLNIQYIQIRKEMDKCPHLQNIVGNLAKINV